MSNVNDILVEITRLCSEKQIRVSFTQYGAQTNKIEETIIHGEKVVEIQIGSPDNLDLNGLLNDYLTTIKG